jgi:MoaA/NifB/PqqE/SkfB family radical SAM enzyme
MRIIRQILRPDPKVLYLEPVFGCNYRCFFCIHGNGPPSPPVHLQPSLFEKLKPLIDRTSHIHFTGLGEPLLNPYLPDYLAYLREKDKTYYINTNGSMITGDHANLLTSSRSELSISLDAGDAATYRKMRSGGSWRKVIGGLKRVAKLKTNRNSAYPLLYLSFHINGLNLMSLSKVPQLARELGIEAVKFSWTRLPEAYRAHSIFEQQEQVTGILRHVSTQLRSYGIKVQNGAVFERHLRSCWNFSEMTFIGPNGSVAACCSRWPTIGNLMNNDFRDIWNGIPRRRLALAIINGRPQGLCQDCPQIRGLDYARNRDAFISCGDLGAQIREEKSRLIEKLPCLDGLETAFEAGVSALLGGGFQKAVDIFSTLDANHRDFFEIKNNLAVAHAYLGNVDHCQAVLKALINIPHNEKMYPKSIYSHPAFCTGGT